MPSKREHLSGVAKNNEHISMNVPEAGDEPCEQCGLCCRIFGDSIAPTPENIFFWIEQKRADILKYFYACKSDGTWVHCIDLETEDLSDLIVVEMRDPVTNNYLSVCPFLFRVGKRKYICRIHDAKPEMCRWYQPWIWGETYFNKCQALKKIDLKGRNSY